VRSAALFGAAIHAVVEDPAFGESLPPRLAAAGFPVLRIAAVLPSLEDVFVSLVERRGRTPGGPEGAGP
jgi:hypothetical protein